MLVPVAGEGANPSVTGSGHCRSEASGVEPHRDASIFAVARGASVRPAAPLTGLESHVVGMLLSFD